MVFFPYSPRRREGGMKGKRKSKRILIASSECLAAHSLSVKIDNIA